MEGCRDEVPRAAWGVLLMRPPRAAVMVVLTGGMLWAPLSTAVADPVVTPGGGRIDTEIVVPGSPGGSTGGTGQSGGQPVGDAGRPAPCTYERLTPEQAIVAGLPVPDGGGAENLPDSGGWFYLRDCSASGGGRVIVWIPDGGAGAPAVGVPVVTPAELALEARNRLVLPEPEFGVSPDGEHGNPPLVNLPTWWWVTNAGSLTQRTQAGPVWAEVTATPYATSWEASDGSREDCPGLGIEWQSWMSETQAGSCRFTYTRASEQETATVETVWRVAWVGSGGTGGELDPMRRATTQTIPVYERQAIITDG